MMSGVFMELVTCPACKREVSSEADRCPHCGQPIKRGLLGSAGTERAVNIGCLIILMIIAFFVFVGSCSGLFHQRHLPNRLRRSGTRMVFDCRVVAIQLDAVRRFLHALRRTALRD